MRFRGYLCVKFCNPFWAMEIREGWFDANVWPLFIDNVLARSTVLTVMRKGVGLTTRSKFRHDGIFRFDSGIIEVSAMGPYMANKKQNDREKLVSAMSVLLGELYVQVNKASIQVVGVLCYGWAVSLFRMWRASDGCHVFRERKFVVSYKEELFCDNSLFISSLVRYVQQMLRSAEIIKEALKDTPE